MIKYFRQIRKNMLRDNKIKKYLIYAFGEVILVMVGILLALQINASYQNSQDRKLEQLLLKELRASIISDSVRIDRNFSNFKLISENAKYLDSMIRHKHPHSVAVDSAFGIISAFNVAEADYVIFERVQSLKSGLITNDSLFKSLSNYYNYSKFLAGAARYFENGAYFRKEIYPKYFKHYRYGSYAQVADYETLLRSNEITVAIDYCINDANFYTNQTRRRKEHARQLIEDISQELERFD